MATKESKLAKAQSLRRSFIEKSNTFYNKSERARSSKNRQAHYEQYTKLRALYFRADDLAYRIEYPAFFPFNNSVVAKSHYAARLERKAKGKEKYLEDLKKPRYSMWHIGNSFSADYGEFVCDKCGDTFYHSPSTITQDKTELYHTCCGYCTNNIIGAYWNSKPYE